MKSIKIIAANKETIETALRSVNGAAKTRTYTTYNDIEELTQRAESKLKKLGLKLSERSGAGLSALSGNKVSSSYKHLRIGTRLRLYRGARAWYLIEVIFYPLYDHGGYEKLSLTEGQEALVVNALRAKYFIGK